MSVEDIVETSAHFDTLDGIKDANIVLSCWPGLLYKKHDLTFKSPGYRSSQNIARLYSDKEGGLLHKQIEYGFGLALGAALNIFARATSALYVSSQIDDPVGKVSAGLGVLFSPEIISSLAGIAKTLYRRYEIDHMV